MISKKIYLDGQIRYNKHIMLDSYILEGIQKEYLLVVKTENKDEIMALIDRLYSSRLKWMKELAAELERSLYDTGSRRDSGKTRPKNQGKSATGNRGGRKKATNPINRSKSRP